MGATCSSNSPRGLSSASKRSNGQGQIVNDSQPQIVSNAPTGRDAFGDDDDQPMAFNSASSVDRIRSPLPPPPHREMLAVAYSRDESHSSVMTPSPSPGVTPAGQNVTLSLVMQHNMNASLSVSANIHINGASGRQRHSTSCASSPFCSLSGVRPRIDSFTTHSAQSSPRSSVDNPLVLMAPNPKDLPARARRISGEQSSPARQPSLSPANNARPFHVVQSCSRNRQPKRHSLLVDPSAFQSLGFVKETQATRELYQEPLDECSPVMELPSNVNDCIAPRRKSGASVSPAFGKLLSSVSVVNTPPTAEMLPMVGRNSALELQRLEERDASLKRVEAMKRDALFGPVVEEGTLSTESCDSSLSSLQ